MDSRIALFTALALLSARVWAEDLPELPETVITATREPTDILDSPSFVTVITQQEIQESGAADLSAVLAQQSGVVVNNYGPQGQTKTVSIRGSSSDQVLVLLDGMRLNSSRDGSVDFSEIPTDDIDHIEIVRGSASTMYGTGAIGGVINIITKKPAEPQMTLSLTNGSYIPHDGYAEPGTVFVPATPMSLLDNQKLSLTVDGKLQDVGLTGGGSLSRGMNAFVWDDTAGLGEWRQRNNAQNLSSDAFAGLAAPLLGGSVSARGSFSSSGIGAPGSDLYPDSQAMQSDTWASGSLSYSTNHFFSDLLSLDAKGFYRYEELTFTYDPSYNLPESIHRTHSASLDVTQKLAVSETVSAVYGGSVWYDYADSTNFASPHDRVNVAGFLSATVAPWEPLAITPSVRYDYFSDFPGYLSFQVSSVLSLSDSTSLKLSLGTAYRAPTLNELYWYSFDGYTSSNYPEYSEGNPSLQPETSYNGELGLSVITKRLTLETSLFTRLVDNEINWGGYAASASNPNVFIETPVNISQALLPGAEIHTKMAVTDQISLRADYTFIYSLLLSYLGQSYDLSSNLRVPYVPIHDLSLSAHYDDAVNTANVEMEYVGQKFTDAANTPAWALAGYVVLNAGYARALTKSVLFSVKLLNILNETYYTVGGFNSEGYPDDPGYPMPPFSIVISMQLKL